MKPLILITAHKLTFYASYIIFECFWIIYFETISAVYFSWPDPQNPSKWQFLGHMSNSKPSAIFKISQLKKLHEMEAMESMMLFGTSDVSHIAQIGVSVEPEESVMAQVPASTNDVETTYVFGKKMLENFVNFASSFSVRQCEMQPNPVENYVPMSTLNTWFTNFERRLQQNPTFWKWDRAIRWWELKSVFY